MRIEKFKRASDESLIIVKCQFPNHQVALALDTGASHTTIDLTALLMQTTIFLSLFVLLNLKQQAV